MSQEKRWHKLESGQALMEYWPTIPAAIMIIISAGLVVNAIRGGLSKTTDALYRSSAGIEIEVCETSEEDETGTDSVLVDTHLVELVSTNFDGTNTTVVYRVTSGSKPSLSHWTLGLPKAVADNIIDESEQWEWTNSDPTTGAQGIKFDTGYEGGSDSADSGGKGKDKGSDDSADTEEDTADAGKGKGKGKDKRKSMASRLVNIYLLQEETTTSINVANGESREIFLLLSGQYEFEEVTVTTKAGNDSGSTGTISAPVRIIDGGHTQTTIKEGCD